MVTLAPKNFPRLASYSQNIKQPLKTFESKVFKYNNAKYLKPLLAKADIILDEDILAINVSSWSTHKELDKSKIIKMLRNCYDVTPNISFYGWNGLMLDLNLQYGSKACLEEIKSILGFVKKHVEAYQESKGETANFKIAEFPEKFAALRVDHIFCKDSSGESCYSHMWKLIDDCYYVYDLFMNDMISFGYTKDQIKVIIHGSQINGRFDMIPNYIKRKYLAIPDGSKVVKDLIESYNVKEAPL